jgi:hypothetical protein
MLIVSLILVANLARSAETPAPPKPVAPLPSGPIAASDPAYFPGRVILPAEYIPPKQVVRVVRFSSAGEVGLQDSLQRLIDQEHIEITSITPCPGGAIVLGLQSPPPPRFPGEVEPDAKGVVAPASK